MDNNEMDKLRILLSHWIEHNKEHGNEFREWGDKARNRGKSLVQRDILDAAQYMDKSSESLQRALNELDKQRP